MGQDQKRAGDDIQRFYGSLRGSVTYIGDIISPIDGVWDANLDPDPEMNLRNNP